MTLKTKSLSITFFLAALSTLVTGCGDSGPTVSLSDLQNRSGVLYMPNQEEPFTGIVEDYHSNGQRKFSGRVKNGLQSGIWTNWSSNGQKYAENSYKEGRLHGVCLTWQFGELSAKATYDEGKLVEEETYQP